MNRGPVASIVPPNRGIGHAGPVPGVQPAEIAASEADGILTEVAAGDRAAGALDREAG